MTFHILVGQRKCSYPGQYAPEALAVMDENGVDENPDYLNQAKDDNEASNEFDALTIVRVFVQGELIDKALYPENPVVDGLVLKEVGE